LDAREINTRNRETNLGNLITDALRQATGADVAIYNGGSIRSDTTYGPGEMTTRDVISILPFENPVVKVEISGAILRAALENGVSQVGQEIGSGGFPQVSGFQFEYDARRPAGSRVTKVSVAGRALDDRKNYTLSSDVYLIKGGDGYDMFKGVKFLIPEESAQIDSTILANAITAVAGGVAPRVEGRIKRIDQ
jgi:5'-nucleotidase